MVLYEVTLLVEPDVLPQFLPWLRAHVQEMKTLPPIHDAHLYEVIDPASGQPSFVAHYWMHARTDYDDYLAHHADRMRADGMARFGGKFTATRRLLETDGPSPATA